MSETIRSGGFSRARAYCRNWLKAASRLARLPLYSQAKWCRFHTSAQPSPPVSLRTPRSKQYRSPVGSSSTGVGSPSSRHRSMKCSCAAELSFNSDARHLAMNSPGVMDVVFSSCSRIDCSDGAHFARQLPPHGLRLGGGGSRSSGSQGPCPRARSAAPVPPPAPAAHPWLSTRRRAGFARPGRARSLLLARVRVEILLQLRQQEECLFHRICYQQDVGHIELG